MIVQVNIDALTGIVSPVNTAIGPIVSILIGFADANVA